jgi:hypothetical protein
MYIVYLFSPSFHSSQNNLYVPATKSVENEIIYFPTIYVHVQKMYCIYRGMSKAPKKLSNCLKRAETSVVHIVFDCVLCEVRAYKLISINVDLVVSTVKRHS